MATLFHFPAHFFFLPSRKLSYFPIHSLETGHHFSVCASSFRRPRACRKLMSNADLCCDLRRFVSAVGLPEGRVPSIKELSQHGRKDLANIVRRRGYKQIKELLANSIKIENEGSDLEIISTDAHGVVMDCGDVLAGHDDKVHNLAIDVPSSFEAPFVDNYLSSMNAYPVLNFCNQNSPSVEAATTNLSLCEVENIFHNGELEKCGDNGYGISNESFDQRDEGYFERENVVADNTSEVFGDEYVPSESNASLNGSLFKYPPPAGNNPSWDHHLLTGGLNRVVKNINAKADERENQVEINHLMFLWHQKEMELSQLKEQIEKEKHALSILQTRAEKEINEVQKLISEKDAELYFAEESLSGLEEVQIQYQGDGETVEVAGSFNGWHDRVKMDPQSSSSVKPRLWTAILWLYPGIYEIKFIVDGNWRIDPQKKTVTMGGIQNNILQVGQSLSA